MDQSKQPDQNGQEEGPQSVRPSAFKKMPLDLRLTATPEERELVYRLRYRVYIDEMKRDLQAGVDHQNQRICDPLDQTALLLAAFHQGSVVGTCRLNFTCDPAFQYSS